VDSTEGLLIRITTPWCCAGMLAHNGRVITTAPILKAMRGMKVIEAVRYAMAHGYQWEVVDADQGRAKQAGGSDQGIRTG